MFIYYNYKDNYYTQYILNDLLECFTGEDKEKSDEAFDILKTYLIKIYNMFLEIGRRYKFCAKEIYNFPDSVKGYIVESIEIITSTKKLDNCFKVSMFKLDTATSEKEQMIIFVPIVWANDTVVELKKFEAEYSKTARRNFLEKFILPAEKQYDDLINEYNLLFPNNRYTRTVNCPRE